jgi:glutamyl-tRNA synthetase/glutamyl-Q tRNA(Asp) synthetase
MLTRFAPAPTGYLHLGHVVNALFVWGVARARGARVLLRIEDHDRQRCRPEYERALLDDLDWLGLAPDLGLTDEFRRGPSPFRQSDRDGVYAEHVHLLRRRGHHVYACDCSRRALAGEAGHTANGESRYRGCCRERGLEPGPGRGLRVVMEPGAERFVDLRLGPEIQEPSRQCGDLLLRDRLGNWTYQFTVVVDDWRQGVDLVIRGEDLLSSTGRQLRLGRMLGRETPPQYLHHPLIRKPGGAKLSKAGRDTSVRDLRNAGETPETLFGRALTAIGRLEVGRPVTMQDALGLVIES